MAIRIYRKKICTFKKRPDRCGGMTFVGILVAMAVIIVVLAAVVPQLRSIQNSWSSKRANAEVIQNGCILMDHIMLSLIQATKITAVSGPAETNGYIEFEDDDENTLRYQIGANNYVQFGTVGSLSDMAGPVSSLQFSCYDTFDLDTTIVDINEIRCVKAQATFTNPALLSRDRTFTTEAYIRTNALAEQGISMGIPFEFDSSEGSEPVLCRIDATHYLCAYTGLLNDGWACVLTVNTDTGTITSGARFEFDATRGVCPDLAQIDATHYLCAYGGDSDQGWTVVLTVDTGNWSVSRETPFIFDTDRGRTPALAKIDNTNYLCAYTGPDYDGWAVILTVSAGTWTIAKTTPFEFDAANGSSPALAQINSARYLCTYTGQSSDGWAVVLTTNTGTGTVGKETPFEFDAVTALKSALCRIDVNHYLCAYAAQGNRGCACVLTVNTGDWTISKAPTLNYDNTQGENPALCKINDEDYLCTYKCEGNKASSVILTIDTGDYSITKGEAFQFDMHNIDVTPDLLRIDGGNHLCAYTGFGDDGWSVILKVGPAIEP